MRRAIEHGAILEMAVGDMPYGDRQGGVRDAHGNYLVDLPVGGASTVLAVTVDRSAGGRSGSCTNTPGSLVAGGLQRREQFLAEGWS